MPRPRTRPRSTTSARPWGRALGFAGPALALAACSFDQTREAGHPLLLAAIALGALVVGVLIGRRYRTGHPPASAPAPPTPAPATDAAPAVDDRYRGLFRAAPDCVLIYDASAPDGPTVMDASDHACEVHGYQREELIGTSLFDLASGEAPDLIRQRVASILAGEELVFETVHTRRDGSTFPVEVITRRLDVDGRPVIQAIDRDITSRRDREREQAHRAARNEQEHVMRALRALAAAIAGRIDRAGASSAEIAALAEQLGAMAGRVAPVPQPVSIGEVLEETRAKLVERSGGEIEVALELQERLPAVAGDRRLLGQACGALCRFAAAQVGRPGKLTIQAVNTTIDPTDVEQYPGIRPGPHVRVRVLVHGWRPAAETLAQPFEPRPDAADDLAFDLPLAHGVIHGHHGYLGLAPQSAGDVALTALLPLAPGRARRA